MFSHFNGGSHCVLPGQEGSLCSVRRRTAKDGWALQSKAWKTHDLPRKPWHTFLLTPNPPNLPLSPLGLPSPSGWKDRPGAAGSPLNGLTSPSSHSFEWAVPQLLKGRGGQGNYRPWHLLTVPWVPDEHYTQGWDIPGNEAHHFSSERGNNHTIASESKRPRSSSIVPSSHFLQEVTVALYPVL